MFDNGSLYIAQNDSLINFLAFLGKIIILPYLYSTFYLSLKESIKPSFDRSRGSGGHLELSNRSKVSDVEDIREMFLKAH